MERTTNSTRARFVAAGLFVILTLASLTYYSSVFSQRDDGRGSLHDQTAVRAAGQVVIKALEDYRAKTGSYPASLAAAGITPPAVKWGTGKWNYELEQGSYYLTIYWEDGNYYNYTYSSRSNRWSLDT